MNLNKNNIQLILVIIIFISLVAYKYLWHSKPLSKICQYEEIVKNQNWNGVLINKFIDVNNHNYKTISILNNSRDTLNTIMLTWDHAELFKKFNIGDSVYKKINSLSVYYSNKRMDLIYNCED